MEEAKKVRSQQQTRPRHLLQKLKTSSIAGLREVVSSSTSSSKEQAKVYSKEVFVPIILQACETLMIRKDPYYTFKIGESSNADAAAGVTSKVELVLGRLRDIKKCLRDELNHPQIQTQCLVSSGLTCTLEMIDTTRTELEVRITKCILSLPREAQSVRTANLRTLHNKLQDGPSSRLTTPFSPHDFPEEADRGDLDTSSRPAVDDDASGQSFDLHGTMVNLVGDTGHTSLATFCA